jgi:hypothetical protein
MALITPNGMPISSPVEATSEDDTGPLKITFAGPAKPEHGPIVHNQQQVLMAVLRTSSAIMGMIDTLSKKVDQLHLKVDDIELGFKFRTRKAPPTPGTKEEALHRNICVLAERIY